MITEQMIFLNQEVTQGKGNIVSDMGGEKVMLSIENGKYYNLGELGGEIWELIQEPTEINKIVATLISSYEVAQEECEKQVVTFLNHLFDEGLIEVVDHEI